MKSLLELIISLLIGTQRKKPQTSSEPKIEPNNDILDTPPKEILPQTGHPTSEQISLLKKALAKRESNNNPKVVNSIGFVGLYQFGAAALEDLGYLKPGSWKAKKNSALKDPSFFTGKDDIRNLDNFLDSVSIQNKCMDNLLDINFKRLKRLKVDMGNMKTEEVCGLLAVAHLLGAGGARDFCNGKEGQDAYGTKASEYYNLGKESVL